MLTIERSSAFKRDYKRVKSTPRHSKNVELLISTVLEMLILNEPLPPNNCDHALNGNFLGYRECHIKPDLLLIYKKTSTNILKLARLGSHSELFG